MKPRKVSWNLRRFLLALGWVVAPPDVARTELEAGPKKKGEATRGLQFVLFPSRNLRSKDLMDLSKSASKVRFI